MHIIIMLFDKTFIAFCKTVTRKIGLRLTWSPVSLDLFRDLNDISLYRQFVK